MSHSKYLNELFSPKEFSESVNSIVGIINERFSDVDYIVGTGISGAIMVGAISSSVNKRIFIIRKENDNTHSYKVWDADNMPEYERFCEFQDIEKNSKTAIIIDDLISSGCTIRRILHKLWDNEILTVGIILYHETGNDYNFTDLDHNLEIPVIQTKKYMD
jgi:adenine/guanine phosphoribosyltransferase-like PRPP-binding protein